MCNKIQPEIKDIMTGFSGFFCLNSFSLKIYLNTVRHQMVITCVRIIHKFFNYNIILWRPFMTLSILFWILTSEPNILRMWSLLNFCLNQKCSNFRPIRLDKSRVLKHKRGYNIFHNSLIVYLCMNSVCEWMVCFLECRISCYSSPGLCWGVEKRWRCLDWCEWQEHWGGLEMGRWYNSVQWVRDH